MIDTVQVTYNIFEQRPEEALLPAALEQDVGIISRIPFEEGLLTGQLGPGYQFEPGDWREEWLTLDRLQQVAGRTKALGEYLTQDKTTLPALALKFCLEPSGCLYGDPWDAKYCPCRSQLRCFGRPVALNE